MPRRCTGFILGVSVTHVWRGWPCSARVPEMLVGSDGTSQRLCTRISLQEARDHHAILWAVLNRFTHARVFTKPAVYTKGEPAVLPLTVLRPRQLYWVPAVHDNMCNTLMTIRSKTVSVRIVMCIVRYRYAPD